MIVISRWDKISSGATFIWALALTDFLAVFYDGIIDMMLPFFGLTVTSLGHMICAGCKFFSWATTICSYYMTVMFSLDKCCAVLFPFKYRLLSKPKVAIILTIAVYVFCCIYSVPALLVFALHPKSETCRPVRFDYISRDYFFDLRPEMGYYFSGFIPIGVVFVCTAIVIYKMRQQGQKIYGNNGNTRQSQKDLEITRQMIVVGIIFAVFCLGFTILLRVKRQMQVDTMYGEAKLELLDAIQSNILALMNSTNFLVYILFGKKFRADFLKLWAKKVPNSEMM